MLPVRGVYLGMGHMVLLGQYVRIDHLHEPVILELRGPLGLDVGI